MTLFSGPHPVRTTTARSARDLLTEAEICMETDPVRALGLLESASTLELRRTDPSTSGRVAYLRARILLDRGEYHEALGALQTARHDMLLGSDPSDTIHANLLRAEVVLERGDPMRAIEIARSVLEELEDVTTGGNRSTIVLLAAAAHGLWGAGLAASGDSQRALSRYDVAWNLFRSIGHEHGAALTQLGRGVVHLQLGLTHRGLDEVTRARRTLTDLGLVASAARCAVPMATGLVRLGRIQEAIHHLDDVRVVFEQRQQLPQLAALDLSMSRALLQGGLAHDARLAAHAAAETFRILDRIDGTVRAQQAAGLACLMAGDAHAAIAELASAERLARADHNAQALAIVLLARSYTELGLDDIEHSLSLAVEGLESARVAKDHGLTTVAHLLIATSERTAERAARHHDEAHRLIKVHGLDGMRLSLDLVTAHLARADGRLEDAAAVLRTALTRESAPEEQRHGTPRPMGYPLFVMAADDALIAVLIELGTPSSVTEAWRWASVSRARVLDDVTAVVRHRHVQSTLPAHLPASSTPQVSGDLTAAFDGLVDPTRRSDPTEVRATHVAARRHIRQSVPQSWLPLSESGAVVLPALPEGPIVQYNIVERHIVAFVIREGQVYGRRLLATASEVSEYVTQWQVACQHHFEQRLAGRVADASLLSLTAALTEPLRDLLEDLGESRLTVSLPPPLQAVPFEELTIAGEPFIERFSLRFASSMHHLDSGDCRRVDDWTTGSLLGLLVPDGTTPRIHDEATALSRAYPDATILTGDEATAVALAREGSQHRVIHLAGHGIFWPEHPASSAIRLADRWLTAGEIRGMDLRGALVILNACSTGRESQGGHESSGLAWSFLAAGCRGVVATTRPVSDDVAVRFAETFHALLRAGYVPAEAVRHAQLQLRDDGEVPADASISYRYITTGATALHED